MYIICDKYVPIDVDFLSYWDCYCFRDNGDDTVSFKGHAVSGPDGAYEFDGHFDDNSALYFVVAWKDNTPNVMDVTDHVLQPTT